mmetsp:Transcript_22888/g.64834  ORF Transcript_22888/g.64834 Transcript_22888/m.64834 type:complete len:328 (-) Transcript_22888:671-1654(-)|eukprot:CAMPEP_0119554738 /NCGR_PEP_ID=MMETSP1352-20130426/7130_1 /TAXON_ID=265584 /ORGANISM="Stauroneis constricta, Strain CCMP1120" /LENGTH=327 /DNA_ID=CAMNT_0007601365 /DNA_START=517 /DNA_END=1500 /DNA_ORIENTATION=-
MFMSAAKISTKKLLLLACPRSFQNLHSKKNREQSDQQQHQQEDLAISDRFSHLRGNHDCADGRCGVCYICQATKETIDDLSGAGGATNLSREARNINHFMDHQMALPPPPSRSISTGFTNRLSAAVASSRNGGDTPHEQQWNNISSSIFRHRPSPTITESFRHLPSRRPHSVSIDSQDTDTNAPNSSSTSSAMSSIKQKKSRNSSPLRETVEANLRNYRGEADVYIDNPGPNDVLCGRGGYSEKHPGNVFFRKLTSGPTCESIETVEEKLQHQHGVVNKIFKRHGKFLKQAPNGKWIDCDAKTITLKVQNRYRTEKRKKKSQGGTKK